MATAIVVAVLIASCTAGDASTDGTASGAPSARRGTTAPSEPAQVAEPAAEPRWTQVELPPEALLSKARITFGGGVLAGNERLPHMVAGTAARPGSTDQVRVWTSDDTRRWATTD
ncbi:MAG TPA: hypothetical protein VK891_12990, partial [Euzebyales bacterium]|nr:hypothetical protein [Euzebyales bacterium]